MSGELYETLGISRNATSEEVRKAYKKRALETHPDRLPPGATPSEKAASEEKFRKVNNAYEVLNDPQNRRLYDQHGVWPPPQPEYPSRANPTYHHRSSSRRHTYDPDPFSDPFFSRHFAFTDPFELFDSIFRDTHPFHTPRHRRTTWDSPFQHAHPFHEVDSLMNNMHRNMMSFGHMGSSPFSAFPSIAFNMPRENGRWSSESTMSQTINGVTHTIHKRRDWSGNEHVTRVFPDGRRIVTINGVEQHGQERLPSPSPGPDPRHVPPPPVMDYSNSQGRLPPPPYSAGPGSGGYYNAPPPEVNPHRIHRSRHHEPRRDRYNTGPVIPDDDMYNSQTVPEPTDHRSHHKKHWWSRG